MVLSSPIQDGSPAVRASLRLPRQTTGTPPPGEGGALEVLVNVTS